MSIHSRMTLRQIAKQYPKATHTLESFPHARIDGRWSLQELSALAESSMMTPDALTAKVAQSAGTEVTLPPAVSTRGAATVRIMLIALLISLTVGGGWGVLLLLSIAGSGDLKAAATGWVHLHGIQQLWGWAGLTIFGVASYLLRVSVAKQKLGILGKLARALLLLGLIIFFSTIFDSSTDQFIRIARITASSCLLAAAALFSLDVLTAITGTRRGLDLSHLFILVGAQWLLIWGSTDLFARIRFASAPVPPDYIRSLLITLSVLGFISNMIFGFGLRLIPGLLNIAQLRHRAGLLALVTFNAGVLFFTGSIKFGHAAGTFGGLMMLVGALLYLALLNFLRTTPTRDIFGVDPRGNHVIRVAFAFFVISLLMIIGQEAYAWGIGEPHRSYVGALRHLLTVGFVSTMILGVGHRLVPVFLKQTLVTPRLFLISASLLILGCVWRVISELLTITGERWAYTLMAPSGILELTALLLFALTILRTLMASRRAYVKGEPITAGTRVREAINARPEMAAQISAFGIHILEDMPAIAPSMTFGALALSEGANLESLLTTLNTPRP